MKNYMQDGKVLQVVVSSPATPVSGDAVRFGTMTGIAVLNEGEGGCGATETMVDFGGGVYDLLVTDVATGGIAVGATLYLHDGSPPTLDNVSASGYFFGFALEVLTTGSAGTINVRHVQSPGAGTLGTGSVGTTELAANGVTAAKITATMRSGYIPLDITTARLLSTNAIANTVEAFVPDGNTNPSLARVNGATDKQLRLVWAVSNSDEITFAPIAYPPDLDDTAVISVKFLAAMEGTGDTPVLTVGYFEAVGDTNAGGNTAAVTGTAVAEYSVDIAHTNVGTHPNTATITLTPGAHTTSSNALYVYNAWVEYTRK